MARASNLVRVASVIDGQRPEAPVVAWVVGRRDANDAWRAWTAGRLTCVGSVRVESVTAGRRLGQRIDRGLDAGDVRQERAVPVGEPAVPVRGRGQRGLEAVVARRDLVGGRADRNPLGDERRVGRRLEHRDEGQRARVGAGRQPRQDREVQGPAKLSHRRRPQPSSPGSPPVPAGGAVAATWTTVVLAAATCDARLAAAIVACSLASRCFAVLSWSARSLA